jgi:hypothetical protein
VFTLPDVYVIRIKGRLGATALSAFPSMAHELTGSDTVLRGTLPDRAAVFGVLAEIEALGLELVELRRVQTRPSDAARWTGEIRHRKSSESGDDCSPGVP